MTSPAIDPTGAAQLIAEQHAREVSGDREAARGTPARALLVRVRLVREGVLTAGEGQRVAHGRILLGQGEDVGSVVGDGDRVLAVRRAAACRAAEGPAVGIGDQLGGVRHDPRLQCQQQPRAQFVTTAGSTGVRHVRVLVHRRSDAMTAELGVDRIPRLAEDRADGMGDVADASAGPGGGDPRGQCAFGRIDHRDALRGLRVAHDEADGGVRGDSGFGDGEVECQQIAVGKGVVVRPSVEHGVVDGRADVVAERPRPRDGS
ncbi:hypothetical protein SANTM175S_01762 [Streptomyces antimycoticus]